MEDPDTCTGIKAGRTNTSRNQNWTAQTHGAKSKEETDARAWIKGGNIHMSLNQERKLTHRPKSKEKADTRAWTKGGNRHTGLTRKRKQTHVPKSNEETHTHKSESKEKADTLTEFKRGNKRIDLNQRREQIHGPESKKNADARAWTLGESRLTVLNQKEETETRVWFKSRNRHTAPK